MSFDFFTEKKGKTEQNWENQKQDEKWVELRRAKKTKREEEKR